MSISTLGVTVPGYCNAPPGWVPSVAPKIPASYESLTTSETMSGWLAQFSNFHGGFMPHGHCYHWLPSLVFLHNISDLLIFMAYFTIPITIILIMQKRRDISFDWMFGCFALFIIACGLTHLMEIVTLYRPYYWLSGGIKALTAAASVPTSLLLIKLTPKILKIPSPSQLQHVNSELIATRDALEMRVRERTRDLEQANEALQIEVAQRKIAEDNASRARDEAMEASQAKTLFLRSISHELRTPLNAIIGYSELILEDHENHPASAEINTIYSSGTHLLALVDDVLDFTRIETGKIKSEPQDINPIEVMDEIYAILTPMAQRRKNEISLNLSGCVDHAYVDPKMFRQIMINLIGNAIKYTEFGKITVTCSQDSASNTIHFLVHDTGIGIPQERMEKIFTPFYQVDQSSTRKVGGVGLGLTISKSLANAMGGDILVQSELGKGSTFELVLPVRVHN